jgi:hypothetical protein
MDFAHEIPYISLSCNGSPFGHVPSCAFVQAPRQLGQRSRRERERLDRDQRQRALLSHPPATALTPPPPVVPAREDVHVPERA